jgi:hypothetical protein
MTINSENKQAIHEVMIADMQQRLYEQRALPAGKTSTLETLVEDILHTNSVSDMNNVLCKYDDLFPIEYLTLEGTLNYVLQLLCNKIIAHENDLRKYSV